MSNLFEAFYRKHIKTDYKSGGFGKTSKWKKPYLRESDEALVQGYNAIWQPAVEFVENKLSELPAGGSNERLYLEALLGTLHANKISAEENIDPASLRQKIDGLVAKLSSLQMDSPSGDLQDYIKTFVGGMNTFHNQISTDTEIEPEGDVPPPDAEAPPPDGGAPEAAPAEEEPEETDGNSQEELLNSLGIGGGGPPQPNPQQPQPPVR